MNDLHLNQIQNPFRLSPIYLPQDKEIIAEKKREIRKLIDLHREKHTDDNSEYLIFSTINHEVKEHAGEVEISVACVHQEI